MGIVSFAFDSGSPGLSDYACGKTALSLMKLMMLMMSCLAFLLVIWCHFQSGMLLLYAYCLSATILTFLCLRIYFF